MGGPESSRRQAHRCDRYGAQVEINQFEDGGHGANLDLATRRDVKPGEAVRSGADESICGDCIHRKIGGLGCRMKAWVGEAIRQKMEQESTN